MRSISQPIDYLNRALSYLFLVLISQPVTVLKLVQVVTLSDHYSVCSHDTNSLD